MYELIPIYRINGLVCYYNIQEAYSEEIVVSAELTKKQAEAILIILNNEDGVFETIKELYEYAKENGIEDKQLVAVCFENGCVLVDDEYPFGIEDGVFND